MDAQKVYRCFVLWGTVFSLANNFVSLFNSQSSNKTKINLQRPRPFVQSFIDMHALRQRHTQIPNTCLCRLYECGRVFPAGVGPGSPSRDSVNWLSMRFSRSVETRRQYGWLRIVFPGARLFKGSNLVPFGRWRHARDREHSRGKPGSALSGGCGPDSTRAESSSIVDESGEC